MSLLCYFKRNYALAAVCSAYTIEEKAIRFRHPDYNPDRAQDLISSSMSRHLSTRNSSSKFMHAFVSNLDNRQTDRQTDKRGQTHLFLWEPEVTLCTSFEPLSVSVERFIERCPFFFNVNMSCYCCPSYSWYHNSGCSTSWRWWSTVV